MADHLHDHHGHHGPPDHHDEPHDLGLSHDLPTLLSRRRALGLLSGAGSEIPEESAGPFPADGSNGVSVLTVYLWHCDREGRYSLYSWRRPRWRPTTSSTTDVRCSWAQ